MAAPLKLYWSERALDELAQLAERAPHQAVAVVEAMEWMAAIGWSLGHPVLGSSRIRYWPVPPQGVYYTVSRGTLHVGRIRDARRLRRAP